MPQYEMYCQNEECGYRPPKDMEDLGPYLHLVADTQSACPTCGKQRLFLYREVDSDVKFAAGRVVHTPGVSKIHEQALFYAFQRHVHGDWGEVSKEDAQVNEHSLLLTDGYPNGRLLSAYILEGTKVWIITEAGRQSTAVLKPEEY